MVRIEIHPGAFEDIKGARAWYADKSEGLGDRFISDLDYGVACIRSSPEMWPTYIPGTRHFILHRFPFAIVYAYDGSLVRIFAVMHLRRSPRYWVSRFQ